MNIADERKVNEMAEYINRAELLESIRNGVGTDLQKIFAELCVRTAKNEDVIDVVRCKDCKYFYYDKEGRCSFGHGLVRTNEKQYCSYGKRREK